MQAFQKPENALKRADELQNVGQSVAALKVLHGAIGHRRFRTQGWDAIQEHIMLRYVQLCVDLRKLQLAREGLHQYRAISQQSNILSLGKVICEFREKAEKRMREAKAKVEAEEIAAGLAGDLEAEESPESLMLSTLQIEVRDETAREVHAVLRFVWDTYKTILDILRTTPKLEKVYHETAQKAFLFCRENQRPQEFKRLCDLLRNHYVLAMRYKSKPEYDALLRPELHLETRMIQLNVAAELSLWKESFNTAEDIHSLGMHELFHKSFRSNMEVVYKSREKLVKWVAAYYEKMSKILWVSDNHLFHALAWLKYLLHVRNFKKNVPTAEMEMMCSTAVLAVLCIPLNVGDTHERRSETMSSEMSSIVLEHQKKMSSILNHPSVPSRNSLKYALTFKGILLQSSAETQKLYSLLEDDFTPLKLCTYCLPVLEKIEEGPLAQYVIPLKRVIFLKLILQLSKVYTSIRVEYFVEHICPKEFLPWREAEKVVVGLVHQGDVQMRLDYAVNAIYFGAATMDPAISLRERLAEVGKHLDKAVRMMCHSYCLVSREFRDRFFRRFHGTLNDEYMRIRQRNRENNQRRLEMQEEQARAAEERKRQIEMQRLLEEAQERKRREEAVKLREEQRMKEEKHKIKSETAQQMLEEIKKIGGGRVTSTRITIKGKQLDEININDVLEGNVDYEDLEKAQEEHRLMERTERIRQRKLEWRKMDYSVRACREEEISLLVKWKADTLAHDTAILLELQSKHEEDHKAAFQEALGEKQIFECVIADKQRWCDERLTARRLEYAEKYKLQHQRLLKLLKQRKIERTIERREAELKRRQLETEKKSREDEERRVLAELEAKRQEEEAHKKKLSDMAERQRNRDMEIEEKLRQKEMELTEETSWDRERRQRGEDSWRRGDSSRMRDDDYPRKRGDRERALDREHDRGERFDREKDRGSRGFDREKDRGGRGFDREKDRADRGFGREKDREDRSFDRENDRGDRGIDREKDREDRGFDREKDRGDRYFDRDMDRGDRSFDRDRGDRKYENRERVDKGLDRDHDKGDRAFDRERGKGVGRDLDAAREGREHGGIVPNKMQHVHEEHEDPNGNGMGGRNVEVDREEIGSMEDGDMPESNGVDQDGFTTVKKKGRK